MTTSTTTLTPKEIAERAFAAVIGDDFDGFARYLADDVVWELAPTVDFFPGGRRWQGKQAVREDFLTGTYATYFDLASSSIEITDIRGGDEHALVFFTLRGKTTRGRDYYNRYLIVVTVSGGLIRSVQEWTNTEYQKRLLID